VAYVNANYPNPMARILQNRPRELLRPAAFRPAEPGEQNEKSIYPIPDIPSDLPVLGTATSVSRRLNNGFQGHIASTTICITATTSSFTALFRILPRAECMMPGAVAYVSPTPNWYHKIDYVHTFSARS